MQIQNQTLELVDVDKLTPHPDNPRRGDLDAIAASIHENGFYGAVVAQRSTGYVLAGNHRLAAVKRDGGAQIPCFWLDVSDVAARRILSCDNRTAALGIDDPTALAELLTRIAAESDGSLAGTGYTQEAFDAVVAAAGDAVLAAAGGEPVEETEEPQIDRAEELLAKWRVEPGQIWKIGAHCLMCGDSTDAAAVARLMQGEKAGLMNTDPPYGVALRLEDNHEASNSAKGVKGHYRHFEKIIGDDLNGEALQAFLEKVFAVAISVLKPHAAWYLWHAQLSQGFFAAAAAAAAQLLVHRQIIWNKPHFVFGRGDYHWKHELCFYGWVKGNRPPFYGERNQTSVWDLKEGGGSIRKDQAHPTQKPVELFAIPIRNHLKKGELAYEPFSGSGSQFVAAQETGVRCFGMELEPKYCAVILERMSKLGLTPELCS